MSCSEAPTGISKYQHRRSIFRMTLIWTVSSHFRISLPTSTCLDLVASISQRGVKGDIRFTSGSDGTAITATAELEVGLGAEGEYTWGVYEFPIDYTKVRYICGFGLGTLTLFWDQSQDFCLTVMPVCLSRYLT